MAERVLPLHVTVAKDVPLKHGPLGRIDGHLERVDAGLSGLNERVDGLSDDMRQRFRVLNDRVAVIENRLVA